MCKRFGFIRSLTHTLTKKHFYLNVLCLVSFVYQEVGNLFYSNDKKKSHIQPNKSWQVTNDAL